MQKSAQKKQQSISSFFSTQSGTASIPIARVRDISSTSRAKSAETNGLFVGDDETPSKDAEASIFSAKRAAVLEEEDDSPVVKRRRQTPVSAGNDTDSRASHSPSDPVSQNGTGIGNGKRPKITARTSKYAFSSSPGNAEAEHEEEDDEESRLVKERLHQKFVKKLGRPDSIADIKRKNVFMNGDAGVNEEAAEEDEDEEAEPAPTSKTKEKKTPASRRGKDNLTPLQRQVVDLKQKHPDALLVVEAGYKYKLFGEDARIAAKVLAIVCIPGKYRFDEHPSEAHLDKFASASFPTHRLHVHVKRLVSAGHKVGIVRQLETAALKAVGNNRNKIFERGLTNLYTKGTYIDDQEALEVPSGTNSRGNPSSGHLLCLTETYPKGASSDEVVQIGMIAVHPGTGDIIYDDFEDAWMRSELETRLLHISPCEFLIVGDVSKATEKLIQHLSGGDDARLERVPKPKTQAAQAYSHITKFYADKMRVDEPEPSQVESSLETGTLLDKVHKLSENATVCLSAMITHLTAYGLQHVFDLTKYFQSFSARSHMLLNGNTLSSLEIYRNQTDQTENGSLFWTLNRTKTRFGQRLLRKWIGRPLLDRPVLEDRVAAVEELKDGTRSVAVERIGQLFGKVKTDLERTLIRIYYKKCTRPELLGLLQTLQMIAQEYAHVSSPADAGFQSEMVNQAIASLPRIADDVVHYLDRINAQAAKSDDKYSFFLDEHETENITDHKLGIAAVEHDLDEFRKVAAEKLRRKQVSYVTVAEIEYLIELDNTQLKNVPASWIKISGTKKLSRYHAPEVVKLIRERDQHKEALSNACDAAFTDLLTEISSKYQAFRDCLQSLAQLDCLLSLADIASQPGYCKPTFTSEPSICITGGRHPMVEQLLLNAFVPNDINLSSSDARALLVTGPNMGGKSSYVRSVALIAIMAQIGSYVPADSAELGLFDAIFTRMGAFDNMLRGESTFMVELSETSDIIKQATPNSLVILDELGRGTSTHDGVAIAQAVLHHAVADLQCLTLFITHYQTLARMQEQFPSGELKNVHMRFTENQDDTGDSDVTFLYQVGEGMAHRSYGLNVAKLAGLPKSIIDEAGRRSKQMEEEETRRRVTSLAKATSALVAAAGGGLVEMEHLITGIEQV